MYKYDVPLYLKRELYFNLGTNTSLWCFSFSRPVMTEEYKVPDGMVGFSEYRYLLQYI